MKTSLEIWQGQEEKPKDTRQWFPQNSSLAGHLRAREVLVVSTLTSGAKNPPFNLPLEIEVETPGSQAFKESLVLVAQSCSTFCNPVDYSSSAHGILQASILEWAVLPFSRDGTLVSCTVGRFFTIWATRGA